ncbi:MAG: thioesterase II family protein [Saprospiraceae bacterium]
MNSTEKVINRRIVLDHSKRKIQVFLLHFAGGSGHSFDFLKAHLAEEFDFIPLELAGRGRRYEEAFFLTKGEAIKDYVNQIQSNRNEQAYLIYGHSMGATLGLSVAKKMEDLGDPASHLIVSGNAGPGVKSLQETKNGKRYLMNDDDFKKELKQMGGIPNEVIENDGLYQFFSSILRADFRILETGSFSEEGTCLTVPICALMGSEEKNNVKIENWKRFTKASFQFQIFEGSHFFIYDHAQAIANKIRAILKKEIVQNQIAK